MTAGGWTAVWTRRGNSETFDGVWTGPQGQRETTVVAVTIDGRNVTANRPQSSDGFLCGYTGQVAADGVTVRGSARCGASTFDWSATITGGRTGPPLEPWERMRDRPFRTFWELTIEIRGSQVSIFRRSGRTTCNCTGTLGADGVTVQGTYGCSTLAGTFTWSAVILFGQSLSPAN